MKRQNPSANLFFFFQFSNSRVVPHDVAHVHLHGQLLQVDGKHHQGLPRCPLLARGLPVLAEGRRRRLGHGIWTRGRKFRLAQDRPRTSCGSDGGQVAEALQ